jgi:hypothetical protein
MYTELPRPKAVRLRATSLGWDASAGTAAETRLCTAALCAVQKSVTAELLHGGKAWRNMCRRAATNGHCLKHACTRLLRATVPAKLLTPMATALTICTKALWSGPRVMPCTNLLMHLPAQGSSWALEGTPSAAAEKNCLCERKDVKLRAGPRSTGCAVLCAGCRQNKLGGVILLLVQLAALPLADTGKGSQNVCILTQKKLACHAWIRTQCRQHSPPFITRLGHLRAPGPMCENARSGTSLAAF